MSIAQLVSIDGSVIAFDTETAMPIKWSGDCDVYYTIPQLRGMGLSWKEIEKDAMTNKVKFDD